MKFFKTSSLLFVLVCLAVVSALPSTSPLLKRGKSAISHDIQSATTSVKFLGFSLNYLTERCTNGNENLPRNIELCKNLQRVIRAQIKFFSLLILLRIGFQGACAMYSMILGQQRV